MDPLDAHESVVVRSGHPPHTPHTPQTPHTPVSRKVDVTIDSDVVAVLNWIPVPLPNVERKLQPVQLTTSGGLL